MPQRIVQKVGHSSLSEQVARVQGIAAGPLIDRVRRSPLHSDVLGHPIHPPLTDVPIGCWLSASLLDVAGGPGSRRGAILLVGLGVLAAVPTAMAGAADWAELSGDERRIGAVHALDADLALMLFVGSLVARLRGRHRTGSRLALAGNVVVSGAGFLGGHLALRRGTVLRD